MANIKFSGFTEVTDIAAVDFIVGYAGAANVQISPINFINTVGGPFLPLIGGTMTGNTIHNDDVKSIYGTTGDGLEIYHDGSNSYIEDTGTGGLFIKGSTFVSTQSAGGENMIKAIADGAVELYHNNNQKLVTTSTGVAVPSGQSVDFIASNLGVNKIRRNTTIGGLEITTGSAPSINIIDSGYVGIGTAAVAPVALLEINGGSGVPTAGGTLIVRQEGDGDADGIALTSSNATSHRFWKDANGKLNIGSSSFPSSLVQDLSGNIGIGTNNPRVQSEIYGEGQLTSDISDTGNTGGTLSLSTNQGSANAGGCLLFAALNDSGNTKPQASIKSLLVNGSGQGVGDLAFSTRASTSATVLTERMRIVGATGSVGIGVNDPSNELVVGGSSNVQIEIRSNDDSGNSQIYFGDTSSSNSGAIIYRHSNDSLGLAAGSGVDRITISSTGAIQFNNYGAGTFTGTVAKSLAVDSSGNIIETTAALANIPGLLDGTSLYVGTVPPSLSGNPIRNSTFGVNAGVAITTGDFNTLVGNQAGYSITSGYRNTALGTFALAYNVEGRNNVALGYGALNAMNPGAVDSYNIGIGYHAGVLVSTGVENVLIGGLSGDAITTAKYNVAVGHSTLSDNVEGWKNVAIGQNALKAMNPASPADTFNVAVGYNAGLSMSSGVQNTLIGSNSGDAITTGSYNTALGYNTLSALTDGGFNVVLGYNAGAGTAATGSVIIGAYAGDAVMTAAALENVAIGRSAGSAITESDRNTLVGGYSGRVIDTGKRNTALGHGTLFNNVKGNYNVALGYAALQNLNPVDGLGNPEDTNTFNIGIGYNAGQAMTTGIKNTIIGGLSGGALTTGSDNITLGYDTLINADSGSRNIAIGTGALRSLNEGGINYNVAIGHSSGYYMSSGSLNTFLGASAGVGVNGNSLTGDGNTAIGYASGNKLSLTATLNTFVGGVAGQNITTGTRNVAMGYSALSTEDTGSNNVAIGYQALSTQDSGTDAYNVAIGSGAGKLITTSLRNALIGGLSGDALTTGSDNVAIGYNSLTSQTTANSNVAIGKDSMLLNIVGDRNVAIGLGTLQNMNPSVDGDTYNTAVGYAAGQTITTGTKNTLLGGRAGEDMTEADNNIAIGFQSMLLTTSANENVAIGRDTLATNTVGDRNVAIGHEALMFLAPTTDQDTYNTAVGHQAGKDITTGTTNTLIGGQAGANITEGNENVAVGRSAMSSNVFGVRSVAIGKDALSSMNPNDGSESVYNVAVGWQAGDGITSGYNHVCIGGQAGNNITTGINNIVIGRSTTASTATVSNEITLGNSSIGTLRCQVTSITALSDQRDKKDIETLPYGLDFVNSLQPKKFVWDNRAETKTVTDKDGNKTEEEFYSANKGKKDIGFIAQELQSVDNEFTQLVYNSNPEKLEATYGRLIPVLVKAIQELSDKVKELESK